jgi:hypothetical protein
MSQSDQEYLIQYLKWVELLLRKESRSASFGTIFKWSGAEFCELSCLILLVEQSAQISYMIVKISQLWSHCGDTINSCGAPFNWTLEQLVSELSD